MKRRETLNLPASAAGASALAAPAPWLRAIALVISLALPASLSAAQPKKPPAPPADEIVALPRFTVTDTRPLPPPESWRYIALRGFEVISNTSDSMTKRFLGEFARAQTGIALVWPDLLRSAKPALPTLVVLCGGNSFKSFVPENATDDIYLSPTSLFLEDTERGAIVVDLMLADALDKDFNTLQIDPIAEFTRQYTRFLLRRTNGNRPLPAWFESGITQLFTTLDVNNKWLEFGNLETLKTAAFGQSTDGNNISNLSSLPPSFGSEDPDGTNFTEPAPSMSGAGNTTITRLLPLETMFSDDPAVRNGAPGWARQCFAFVHFCLYGAEKKYQAGLVEYARRACAGPVTEKDFQESFGLTYKQMESALRSYIARPTHTSILLKTKSGSGPIYAKPTFDLRDATEAESGRIKGETLRLAGRLKEASNALIIPYLRKVRDPNLLASIGLLEMQDNDPDRARKFLEDATKENVVRPRAYVALAQLRLAAALAAPAAADGKLDARQLASVLEPIFTARAQLPLTQDAYALIAEAWNHASAQPTDANLEILLEGVLRYPQNIDLLHATAQLEASHGTPATADMLIKRGIRMAPDGATIERFESLRAQSTATHP